MNAHIRLDGVALPDTAYPFDLYDEDGCPTDEALDAVRRHQGTLPELVALVCALYRGGGATLQLGEDGIGRPAVVFTTVTMGWSGCEAVDEALTRTLFRQACWESSSRGGRTIYAISHTIWFSTGTGWGDPTAAILTADPDGPEPDPARIPVLLDTLRRAWEAHPGAALAQLLVSTGFRGYTTDAEFTALLDDLAEGR